MPPIERDSTIPPKPQPPSKLAIAVDALVVVGVLVLIGMGKLTPSEGLPWLAALLASRMTPKRGSGTMTILGIGIKP